MQAKQNEPKYPSTNPSQDAAPVSEDDNPPVASQNLSIHPPSVQDPTDSSDGVISNDLPSIEIRPLEELLFPIKESRLCRTMSINHLKIRDCSTVVKRGHTSLSGETIVDQGIPQMSASVSFVEEVSLSISSLDLAGIQSDSSTELASYNSDLQFIEQRQKEKLDVLKSLPFYNAVLEENVEEHLETIAAQRWRTVRKSKVEAFYGSTHESIRVQKAKWQKTAQELKCKLRSKDDLLQKTISASQKVQEQMDQLKQRVKTTSEEYIDVQLMPNSVQKDQIIALKQKLERKEVEFQNAVVETKNLHRRLADLIRENRAMTRNFIVNQRGFEDNYIRQGQLIAYLDQDPSRSAGIQRDLAYKDKMYHDLEKRAVDCAGEL